VETDFLARAEEQERFLRVLKLVTHNSGEPDEGFLVLIHGHGGIGKSKLLEKYGEISKSYSGRWPWRRRVFRATVDWERVRRANPRFATIEGPPLWAVLGVIYTEISRTVADDRKASRLEDQYFDSFRQHAVTVGWRSVDEYVEESSAGERNKEDGPSAKLATSLADLVGGSVLSFPVGSVADVARRVVRSLTAGFNGPAMARQRFKRLVGPEQELVNEFSQALRKLSRQTRPFVIFLDTSEILGDTLLALCEVIKNSGARTVWVVGTRLEDPDDAAPDSRAAAIVSSFNHARLRRIPLTGFDRDTIAEYLHRRLGEQLPPGVTVDRVAKATRGGVPLLLSLAVGRLQKNHPADEVLREVTNDYRIPDIVKDHTTRLLVHVERDEFRRDRDLIYGLVLAYDIEDTELLARMWDVDRAEVAEMRRGLSERHDFVLSRGGGPHEDVRSMVRALLLGNDRRSQVRDANYRAVRLLRQRLSARSGGGVAWQVADADWTSLVVQLLWHTFWTSVDEGIRLLAHLLPATHALAPRLSTASIQVAGYFLPACTPAQRRVIQGLRLVFPGTPLVANLRSKFRQFETGASISPLRPAVETLLAAVNYPSPVLATDIPAQTWLAVCQVRYPETFGVSLRGQADLVVRLGTALDPATSPALSRAIGKRAEQIADQIREATTTDKPDGYATAVAVAEVATRFAPNEVGAWWSLGLAHAAAGDAAEGIKAYDSAIRLDTSRAALHSNRGFLMAELGRYQEAIRDLDEALRLEPANAHRHANRVDVLLALGRADEAVAAATEAVRLEPTAQRYIDLGLVNEQLGRLEAALTACEEAARLEPQAGVLRANCGNVLVRLDRLEEALTAYDEALRLEPSNAQWHANRAILLERLGRREDALTSYNEALRLEPNNAHRHANRGYTLGQLGRHEEALTAYDEALRLEPNNAQLKTNRGYTLGQLGRHEEALTAANEALHLEPDNAQLHANRAYTLNRLGRHEEALTAYDEALRLEPNNAQLKANRGYALGQLGRHEEALAAYDEALLLEPDNASWHSGRALALRRLGRKEESLSALEHARLLDPRDDSVLNNLGEAYLLAGRTEEAIAALRSALTIDAHKLEASVLLAVLLRHKEPYESRKLCLRVADVREQGLSRFRVAELHAIRRMILGEAAEEVIVSVQQALPSWTPADEFQEPLYDMLKTPPQLDVDPLLAVWNDVRNTGAVST
jgi:tetratricopeptide (TPR) repeat protein